MIGYVKLHRKIKQHWLWNDPVKFQWWILMILEANHTDGKAKVGNDFITVKRGQSAMSIRSWATLFNAGVKATTNFLELLQKDGMIQKKTVGNGKQSTTLITIENYELFQGVEETQKQRKGNAKETQAQREGHTIQECNNEKNVKNDNKGTNVPSVDPSEKIDWAKLLSIFNKTFGKSCTVVNDQVKVKYKARLKDGYTKEQIVSAMQNASRDEYHRDSNYKHCTLEFFSRANMIDKWGNVSKPVTKQYNPR